MPDHPLDGIVVTGLQVNKAAFRGELKRYARDWGTAAEFNTFDLPGVTIAVIDGQMFEFDPLDFISPDNGTTVILDASSRRFKRQSAAIPGEPIYRASNVLGTNAVTADTNGMETLSATPQLLRITFINDNTNAMTLALDGAAAVPLQIHGAAIATGTILANIPYIIEVTSTSGEFITSGSAI